MNDEKRMAGDYEIIHAIHIGDKEVVFGQNKNDNEAERYICGYCNRNELFEQYDENFVSPDYLEIMTIFCDRVKSQIQQVRDGYKLITVPFNAITPDMCCQNNYSQSIVGKVVAIKQSVLRNEYQTQVNQLFLVTGGFGAEANSRGSACFCTNLYTGKNTRWERCDIQGEVKPECMPQWAKDRLEVIKTEQTKEKASREVR